MSEASTAESFSSPFQVRDGYRGSTPFTPEIALKFIGMRIAAPAKVVIDPADDAGGMGDLCRIPISMTYQFSLGYQRKFTNITDHMVVVAVNAKSGKSYSNTLGVEEQVAVMDDSEFNALVEELTNTYSEGYLTFDLIRVLKIPRNNAVYNVHVTLEGHQSNVAIIEVKIKEK